jgi:diguanylate cyclase (GGDEF)-like protein
VPQRAGDGETGAELEVERAALAGEATACDDRHGLWALGRPLLASREPKILGALAVCREDGPFTREQRELFTYLAAQTAASIEAIDLHERLRNPGLQDELTGLANHCRFRELLDAAIERSRLRGDPLSVLVVELDELRRINGEQGFAAGDEVLLAAAAVLREQVREEPARIGGGTLAITLADSTLDAAASVGGGIQVALARRGLSTNIGIASLCHRVATPEALIAGAEAACREARDAGPGRLAGFRGPYEASPR